MMRLTDTVKHLIIINVIFFIAGMIKPELHEILFSKLALFFPQNPNFGIWQFVSHMFLHGSLMHLFFNMFALAMFGSALEVLWGRNKFLIFYFATGIGAGLVYTLVNYWQFNSIFSEIQGLGYSASDIYGYLKDGQYPTILTHQISQTRIESLFQVFNTRAVGASGALYGVLVAFAFKYPNAELALIFLPIPFKAKYFVPVLVALDLFMGLGGGQSIFGGYGTGIAHFAHVGGALVGYLLMLYFRRDQFQRWD